MKVGIIGCGRISRAHVKALSTVPGAELVGVCDRDRDRALEIASLAPGAKGFDDPEVMIRELGLEAVHVLTPPATHAGLAIQAMEAGCHVFVEKPMAISTAEAADVIAAAERTNRKLCIGHNYLFKPSVEKALRWIRAGAVGEIVYLNTYYGLAAETGSYATAAGRAQSAWRWHLRGGVFADFLPHLVYLQLGFIESIDRITGVTMLPRVETGRERSEMAVQFEGSGAMGSMIISMRAKPYAKYIEIYGTKGIIHADLAREVCVVHREKRMPGALSKLLFSLEASTQLGFGTAATAFKVALGRMKSMPELSVLVGRFYESIRNDTPPPVPLEQGRQTVDAIERIWAALPAQQLAPTPPARVKQQETPITAAEKSFASIVPPGTRVFVSGATGFLGQRLIRSLARCGADIVALVRDDKRVPVELQGCAKFVVGDLRDASELAAHLAGVTFVFHCAAVTTNAVPWRVHYDTNVRGTENLVRAAAQARVRHIVHTSSVAVYGLDDRARAIDESEPLPSSPDRWAYYIRTKIEAEQVARAAAKEHGAALSILRLGLLYGPGAARPVGRGLVQVGSWRFILGGGGNHLPYTFVDNAVDCMLLAAEKARPGIEAYNVVDGPPVTVRDAAARDGRLRGEAVRLIPIPAFLLSTLARVFEFRSRAGETAPKLTRYVVRSATRNIVYNSGKARTELGWKPAVDLDDGLRMTQSWGS
jgi:nucleoside-diphosphate-sugar epimerase/predicted dehydrogenase